MTLIVQPWDENGVPANPDTIVFRSPDGTYGIRRTDTGAVIVTAGIPLQMRSIGVFQYFIDDPANDIDYEVYIEIVVGGDTAHPIRIHRIVQAPQSQGTVIPSPPTPRTNNDAVASIVELDPGIVDISPFILTANSLVTSCCSGVGYDNYTLELIERWLAAHFYKIRDQAVAMENVKGVQEQYQYKLGLNLNATMYGQQAMMIDVKGGLSRQNVLVGKGTAGFTASLTALGTHHTHGGYECR